MAALAARQYAVVSLDQLRELGLSRRAVQDRADSGRLHRIHHAVYSLVPLNLLGRNGRYMAAVLACGPNAALSYRSAAALHEIRRTARTNIDVTIPGRSPRKHAGIDVHRSTTLTPERRHNGPRHPLHHGRPHDARPGSSVVKGRPLERALDQAEILGLLDLAALDDQIARNRPAAAARRLQAVLDQHYIGSTPTWSELEEALLAACRRARAPDARRSTP